MAILEAMPIALCPWVNFCQNDGKGGGIKCQSPSVFKPVQNSM